MKTCKWIFICNFLTVAQQREDSERYLLEDNDNWQECSGRILLLHYGPNCTRIFCVFAKKC